MARIRTVKPDTFRSRSLAKCPIAARYTFIGLWTEADDAGRGLADPRILKGALYPLDDDVTHLHVSAHLDVLAGTGHIRLYEVDGDPYFEIQKFTKHQSAAYRRGDPKYPAPVAGQEPAQDSARERVQDDAACTAEVAGREGKGREGKGTELLSADADGGEQAPLFETETETSTSTEIEVAAPVTAQTITGALIDECRAKNIDLPKKLIGQYAKGIHEQLTEGRSPRLIWSALSLMASENILNRPALLPNKIVTAQTGPERAPLRTPRSTTDERVAGWLNLQFDLEAA